MLFMVCIRDEIFGILLNLGHMEGNFFLNGILSFSGEIVSELGSGYLADIKGRI